MEQIYEYCIARIIEKQAIDFYKNFPMRDISASLTKDFCRMEHFRRKDNFEDFCLALYQQIECICNRLCDEPKLNDIAERMWQCPAYVKWGKNSTPSIDKRSDNSDYTVAALVFGKAKDKATNKEDRSKKKLQEQTAIYKMRAIVYFIGYGACMRSADYDIFKNHTAALSDIYQCRNLNHRGGKTEKWQEDTLNRILPSKSVYFLKFLGTLTQFVEETTTGMRKLDDIHRYALSLIPKMAIPEQPGQERTAADTGTKSK